MEVRLCNHQKSLIQRLQKTVSLITTQFIQRKKTKQEQKPRKHLQCHISGSDINRRGLLMLYARAITFP